MAHPPRGPGARRVARTIRSASRWVVHITIPGAAIAQRARRTFCYFRTGIAAEGTAWLCDSDHSPLVYGDRPAGTRAQHVDVKLRFWNRRNERVSVIEITDARIPLFSVELVSAPWQPFKELTLEEGAPPQRSFFALVPKNAPDVRVEASTGAFLEIEFRPSRGSEKWARPRLVLPLGLRRTEDPPG